MFVAYLFYLSVFMLAVAKNSPEVAKPQVLSDLSESCETSPNCQNSSKSEVHVFSSDKSVKQDALMGKVLSSSFPSLQKESTSSPVSKEKKHCFALSPKGTV